MEILPCSSSPCCYVNLKGKLVAKSSNTNKSKLQTFRKGRILFAKIECVNGSLRFHNLGQSFLRNPNHQGGFGSSNAHQSDKHVDSKVLSGSYNGYVIDGEEDARTLSETGKSGTKVLIPGLPDESSGESAAPIRSCFWQWKPKFNVHYEKTGCENVTSPPVLFLPGFGVGSFHYDKQLKDLGRDHSVWAIDFLGQGMSLPFEGPTPMSKEGVASDKKDQARGFGDETEPWASELVYSMDLWQDQVRYFIEQVIGEPVYLVGNSLGGYVALYFAACNPHLVKGVTLLNATPFWGFLPNSIKSPRLARLFPWAGTFPLPSRVRKLTEIVWQKISDPNSIPIDTIAYRMKRKLNNIVEILNTIADERFKIHLRENLFNVHGNESTGRLQTDSYLHASEIFGRDEEKEKITTFLMDPSDDPGDVSVFPIVGMGGLGKTTLAKLVYNDKSVEEHFERRIWVCVSEEFDVKKIMRAVVESATGSRCDLLEMETIHRRVQELMTRKRFLLVLDDVWNEDHEKWDRLKNSMRHGSVGSKVLVTTRSEKVALIMGTVSPYHLKCLSDENCWLLFQKRAFKNGKPEETSNLIANGKEIARKCKGVSLAAKALGSSLALKRTDDWLNVQNSEMWKFMGEEDGILPLLRLSYRYLPTHLKRCFAYCSLFPKDYKIKKENLIHLWMAEGFIQPTRGKQLEAVANECFNELLCRSFFQNAAKDSNGDIVECEMHHLLHDLAKSVAGNACLMLGVCQQPIIPSDTRHLSVLCNETKKMKFIRDNLKLRSLLLLFGQQKIAKVPHNLIMRMKCLRALDISSTRIKKLSKSVGALKHLRYLNLSHTHIKKLPDTICSLYNLETLLLLQCIRLEKLPDDLRKLINLRHLNIYGCGLLSKLPNRIGELTSLKTLPTFIVGREIGCGIHSW
nr:putative disease resistance protein RGA3 [Ziziphus jujuba var. spinosa]